MDKDVQVIELPSLNDGAEKLPPEQLLLVKAVMMAATDAIVALPVELWGPILTCVGVNVAMRTTEPQKFAQHWGKQVKLRVRQILLGFIPS